MKKIHKKIIVITSLFLSAIFLYGNRPPAKFWPLQPNEENQFLKHPESWSEITDGALDGLFLSYTPVASNAEVQPFWPSTNPGFVHAPPEMSSTHPKHLIFVDHPLPTPVCHIFRPRLNYAMSRVKFYRAAPVGEYRDVFSGYIRGKSAPIFFSGNGVWVNGVYYVSDTPVDIIFTSPSPPGKPQRTCPDWIR